MITLCCQNVVSGIYALLSSNPPDCQDWGEGGRGQTNLGAEATLPLLIVYPIGIIFALNFWAERGWVYMNWAMVCVWRGQGQIKLVMLVLCVPTFNLT